MSNSVAGRCTDKFRVARNYRPSLLGPGIARKRLGSSSLMASYADDSEFDRR